MKYITTPFNPFDYFDSQEDINDFLQQCEDNPDPNVLASALKHLTTKNNVGILSKQDYIKRTIAIAKGEHKPQKDEPKVWCESIETLKAMLIK